MESILELLMRNPQLLEQYSQSSDTRKLGELWCNSNGASPLSSTASTPSADSVSEEPIFTFPDVQQFPQSACAFSDVEAEVQKMLFGTSDQKYEYSRKVFVGGLPSGAGANLATAEQLESIFSKYGPVKIDWPNREPYHVGPIGGYAFAIFASAEYVPALLDDCKPVHGKLSLLVRLGNYQKLVQIRPWSNKNRVWTTNVCSDAEVKSYQRHSIFLGGVPRTATAEELARIMTESIGNVVQIIVETDIDTEYPKGAARVIFASREAYISAVARRVICFKTVDGQKEMEMKPYLDGNFRCDRCGQQWKHFCAELRCLNYLCDGCWAACHVGLEAHRPMVRGAYHVRLMKSRESTVPRTFNRHSPPNLLDMRMSPFSSAGEKPMRSFRPTGWSSRSHIYNDGQFGF